MTPSFVRVRTVLAARLAVLVVGVVIAGAVVATGGGHLDGALVAVVVVGAAVIAAAIGWNRLAYSDPEPWDASFDERLSGAVRPFELVLTAALYWVVMPLVASGESKPRGAPLLAIAIGAAIGTAWNLRRAIRIERRLHVSLYRQPWIPFDREETVWARPTRRRD